MLYGGLTLEEALSGRSKIRNRVIAEVFSRMEIIEEWGTGIKRIIRRAEEYGLPKPDFQEIGDTFRVILYRKTDKKEQRTDKRPIKTDKKEQKTDKGPIKNPKHSLMMEREEKITEYVDEYGSITNREARELLGLAESTVKRILREMVRKNMLSEIGERKTRKYLRSRQ